MPIPKAGGDHHADLPKPFILPQRTLSVAQSAVVGRGRDASAAKVGGLFRCPRGCAPLMNDAQTRTLCTSRSKNSRSCRRYGGRFVRRLGPAETAAQDMRSANLRWRMMSSARQFRWPGRERQHGDAEGSRSRSSAMRRYEGRKS